MFTKKYILFLFLSISLSIFSQQKADFWNKVRFGGGFSLGLGGSTTIGISPSAIYDLNSQFSLGMGLNYMYSKAGQFSTHVYGASLLSLYRIPKIGVQLSGEYEYSFAKQTDIYSSINKRFPALYLGIAYLQGSFSFGIRYDVLYDKNDNIYASPFSPVIRFYF